MTLKNKKKRWLLRNLFVVILALFPACAVCTVQCEMWHEQYLSLGIYWSKIINNYFLKWFGEDNNNVSWSLDVGWSDTSHNGTPVSLAHASVLWSPQVIQIVHVSLSYGPWTQICVSYHPIDTRFVWPAPRLGSVNFYNCSFEFLSHWQAQAHRSPIGLNYLSLE